MQDKLPHIDRKFTDRAWGEMRQMLDREMPTTERRRRRGIFWWWLLPVGLVLGVAAWGFLKNQSIPKPAEPSVVQPTQPVAGNLSAPPAASDSPAPIISRETHLSESFKLSERYAEQLPGEGGGTHLSESLKLSERSANSNLQTFVLKPPALLEQNALSELAAPATFPSLYLPEFLQKSLMENPVKPDLAISKSESAKTRLSIYAGGMATAGSPANGLAVGSLAAYPLKNSKLSLEGGLGYAFVQQPLAVRVNNSYQTGGDQLLYSIRTNFKNNTVQPEAISSTNYSTGLQLHYLQAPLSASYRLGSKFSVHGGAVAAYLVNSAKGFDQEISLDAGGNDPIYNAEDSTVEIPLSRFDLAATGGLTWHFAPAFALDFHYQFGVADLLKSNGIGDYNRLFQLSLRYQLRSKK